MTTDVYYYNTPLILHGNGTDASTTTTDTSHAPHTFTAGGNAQLDTAQKKYGTASMLFDGTGDYFTTPDSADWDFGVLDFTVEMWVRWNSATGDQVMLSNWNTTNGWYVQHTSAGNLAFGSGGTVIFTQPWAPSNGQWYHIAVCRASGTLRAFIDGTQLGASVATSADISGSTVALLVGALQTGAQWFNGWIDDVRITNGIARYTANFTAPAEEFPDTGVTGSMTLDLPAPLQTLQTSFGAYFNLTAPLGTVQLYTGFSADLTAPSPTLLVRTGSAVSLTAPSPTLVCTMHDATGENAIDITAPSPTLEVTFGAYFDVAAPSPTLTVSMTGTSLMRFDGTAPRPTLTMAGTVSAVMQAVLAAPKATIEATFGGNIWLTAPSPTVEWSGTTGAVASFDLTCPLFELEVDATAQSVMRLDLTAPLPLLNDGSLSARLTAPMATLVMVGTATVAVTYEAYSLNLKHTGQKDPVDELTRYTNFPFTHVVRYRGNYFGVAADGLYLLEGTTDYASATPTVPTSIPWAFKTGMTDFGSPAEKSLQAAYFGGRIGANMTVTMYEGDETPIPYTYASTLTAAARKYRQRFGLGSKATYYAVGAAGSNELNLDALEFDVAQLSRRI